MSSTTIEWLGTGSGLNLALGNTSFLLRGPGERLVLVDCGFTVPQKLLELGVLEQVTDVLITHLHADHIGGLETFSFFRYFVHGHRDERAPVLHVPTEAMAHALWQHSLRAGMRYCVDSENHPFDASLTTYFQLRTGTDVVVDGYPGIRFEATSHVPLMPNYAVHFDNGVYYSADSCELPPFDARLIFQDVKFTDPSDADIHASYAFLCESLPPEVKAKTWLVHLGFGYEKVDPVADGFCGYVQAGQTFEI